MSNPATLNPPWKPGQSGNPNGRPKGSVSLARILKEKLAENDGEAAKAIVDAMIKDAKREDGQSRRLAIQYIDGKPKENGGEPIETVVRIVDDI